MTNKEMQRTINDAAKSARKSFAKYGADGEKIIDINYSLPTVALNGIDSEYFFQGEEASNLLEEATNASNKFNVSVEDALIWMSQGW